MNKEELINSKMRKNFDKCIAMAIGMGRKYMGASGKKPTTKEWDFAVKLFIDGYYDQ